MEVSLSTIVDAFNREDIEEISLSTELDEHLSKMYRLCFELQKEDVLKTEDEFNKFLFEYGLVEMFSNTLTAILEQAEQKKLDFLEEE